VSAEEGKSAGKDSAFCVNERSKEVLLVSHGDEFARKSRKTREDEKKREPLPAGDPEKRGEAVTKILTLETTAAGN